MGLFKSADEREASQRAKMEKWANERGLNGLNPDNFKQVGRIKSKLWGTGILSGIGASEKDIARNSAYLLQAITEQNWLMIKQNDQLAAQNEKIISLLEKNNER